jgi:opacity protein-like surface antigen
MECVMKKLTLTLLAGAALAMPAILPAAAQNAPQNQQPQAQQQNNGQANQQQANQPDQNQQQANQADQNQNQPQASNQAISPNKLGRNGVRQVQQALAKKGFHAGRADGIWGRDTRTALKDFQKSKGIQNGKGQLNKQTLSDLGVNIASNDQNQNGNNSPSPNQNQNQ